MGNDLDDLRKSLADNARSLAIELLGEPNAALSRPGELRFGSRGSVAVVTAGGRAGAWFDHERGEGDDMLALIQRERRCGFVDAVRYAAGFVSLDVSCGATTTARQRDAVSMLLQRDAGDERERQRDAQAKQERALDLWREAEPIAGTPAERYLRGRCIDPAKLLTDPPGWPETLRWHPRIRAMLVAVNDAGTSRVVAVHRIFLDDDGGRSLTPDGAKRAKLSLGPVKGNSAMLSAWPDLQHGRWGIAEGPETALAATQLSGHGVSAALSAGNMPHVRPPTWARHVTIFADNDESGTGMKAAAATLAAFRARGLDCRVLRAPTIGQDAADVLMGGVHA